jgi:hypothetical protein
MMILLFFLYFPLTNIKSEFGSVILLIVSSPEILQKQIKEPNNNSLKIIAKSIN